MNPEQEIASLYDNIADIAEQKGLGAPQTIVMSPEFFSDWYYYCEENGLGYTNWEGVPITIDKSWQPGTRLLAVLL